MYLYLGNHSQYVGLQCFIYTLLFNLIVLFSVQKTNRFPINISSDVGTHIRDHNNINNNNIIKIIFLYMYARKRRSPTACVYTVRLFVWTNTII